MNRTEILQEAFDHVVAMLEVAECTDWGVIHKRVADKLGISEELLSKPKPERETEPELVIHNHAPNRSPSVQRDCNMYYSRVLLRTWVGYDENGHGMFSYEEIFRGKGFSENDWLGKCKATERFDDEYKEG